MAVELPRGHAPWFRPESVAGWPRGESRKRTLGGPGPPGRRSYGTIGRDDIKFLLRADDVDADVIGDKLYRAGVVVL